MRTRGGFLLFEVLVAIVIVTAGLLVIIRSYSSSRKAFQRSIELCRIPLVVEKVLWEFEERGEIEEGDKSGDLEGTENYHWNIRARRLEDLGLNCVTLELSQEGDPDSVPYSVSTYLRDKG